LKFKTHIISQNFIKFKLQLVENNFTTWLNVIHDNIGEWNHRCGYFELQGESSLSVDDVFSGLNNSFLSNYDAEEIGQIMSGIDLNGNILTYFWTRGKIIKTLSINLV
jgi:hypothetical protein